MYYYNPKKIDLTVLRRDAVRLSSDTRFTSPAPVVTIHHHGRDDNCAGKTHETFQNGNKV